MQTRILGELQRGCEGTARIKAADGRIISTEVNNIVRQLVRDASVWPTFLFGGVSRQMGTAAAKRCVVRGAEVDLGHATSLQLLRQHSTNETPTSSNISRADSCVSRLT